MVSIHRKLKLAFVFSDGDGGFVFKANLDGEVVDMPLDQEICLRLAAELVGAARQLRPPHVSHEALRSQYGVKP